MKKVSTVVMATVVSLVLACASMPWTQDLWSVWRSACGKSLAQRAELRTEAARRAIPVDKLAEAVCKFSDVVAPFAAAKAPGKQVDNPADVAIANARALGVLP